jgi:hypothetical protein
MILDEGKNMLIDISRLAPKLKDKIKEQEPLYTLQSVLSDFNRVEANKLKKLNAKQFAELKKKPKRKLVIY